MSKNPYLMHDDLKRAKRILAGDREAFEAFFEDYFDPLYRFALGRVHDEFLAKDLVQSTFCNAIEKLESYRGEAALLSWMCSICRFEITAHYRKARRETVTDWVEDLPEVRAVLENLATRRATAEDEAMAKELTRLVHLCLDHLPSHYGQVLEWKYFEGLPVVEIAERLDMSAKAAESVLTRARDAFRRTFPAVCGNLRRSPKPSLSLVTLAFFGGRS